MTIQKQILRRVIRLEWEIDTLRCALQRDIDAFDISHAIDNARVDIEDLKAAVTRDLHEIEKALDALPQACHMEQLELRLSDRLADVNTAVREMTSSSQRALELTAATRAALIECRTAIRRGWWSFAVALVALAALVAAQLGFDLAVLAKLARADA